MAEGVEPSRVAFVSFTTAAVNEARARAQSRFGLVARDLPYFRTLHSLAFSSLGLGRNAVLGDYATFAREVGMRLRGARGIEAVFAPLGADDVLLHAHQLCAATQLPFAEVVRRYRLKANPERYAAFLARLIDWKTQNKKIEYSDMLGDFLRHRLETPVEVAFVDEAQDLTPQQWSVVHQAFAGAREMWVAGDDDQAIYHWAGADVMHMLSLPGEHIVLDRSHRLPNVIKALADGISARIRHRKPKVWSGTGRPGSVDLAASLATLKLEEGSWMMLARSTYGLRPFTDWLESAGVPYRINGVAALADAEVASYRAMIALRAGEAVDGAEVKRMLARGAWAGERLRFRASDLVTRDKLDERALLDEEALLSDIEPKRRRFMRHVEANGTWDRNVEVSTIHQAKGAEADHVMLNPVLSGATEAALRSEGYADDEHRVWYVGASRARRSFRLLRVPGTPAYPLRS